ncbi:MAG: DUF4738 domain-containing protein [Prevotella sp.]|jgi:hypothetical protein
MKKAILYCLPLLFLGVVSCKDKPQSNIIIAHRPMVVHQQKPQVIGDAVRTSNISWVGSKYTVKVSIKCDTSLPLATDGSTKYYDNRVNISILRADGSSFFNRTFTKSDFKPYVDDSYYDGGALIGIVFDKVAGESLKFAVSVGNPDKTTDEFIPLELTVSHVGGVSIEKANNEDEQ